MWKNWLTESTRYPSTPRAESNAHESGRRRQVAGQADSTHSAAVSVQLKLLGEAVFRIIDGKAPIVIEVKQLDRERRIVRQNAHGIIIDENSVV